MNTREESCSEDDSDRELQVAFAKGLLKPGLNIVETRAGLRAKLAEFSKSLDFIERLDVTSVREEFDPSEEAREDDFKREMSFYKQAQQAVIEAIPKLHERSVCTLRPLDYFAEMAKSDQHMKKVRERLLTMQQAKERSETAKRLREQKKYASSVQKQVMVQRQKEKRKLLDAVKKHRKGMKDQLEEVLEGPQASGGKDKRVAKKRAYRDEKYGFGGQKRKSKFNTAESSAQMDGFVSEKHSKRAPKAGGKQKRVGKRRRQQNKANKR